MEAGGMNELPKVQKCPQSQSQGEAKRIKGNVLLIQKLFA